MTATSFPIRKLAKYNTDFRREVVTGPHEQVVLMGLQPDCTTRADAMRAKRVGAY